MTKIDPPIDVPLTLGAQIEARAEHPMLASRPVLHEGDRTWSYREYRDECVRTALLLLARLGKIDERRPGHVAMFLENHLELMALYGGCAYAGLTLFGVNTGLRGETLAGVIAESRARVLVVDEKLLPEIEPVRAKLGLPDENILVVPTRGGPLDDASRLDRCLDREVGSGSLAAPDVTVQPDRPLMVIYT
ncbi:MAG: AMP-binding protein, partial [Myxococcota bacterium]